MEILQPKRATRALLTMTFDWLHRFLLFLFFSFFIFYLVILYSYIIITFVRGSFSHYADFKVNFLFYFIFFFLYIALVYGECKA